MSTRVQKGNAVFRPVAKPRARIGSEARQTPQVPEHRASAPPAHGGAPDVTVNASMPPPQTVPQKPPSLTWVSPDNSAGQAVSPPHIHKAAQPPSIATAISTPSRNTTRPPSVQNSSARPSIPSARHEGTRPTPVALPMQSRNVVDAPQTASNVTSHSLPPRVVSTSATLSHPYPLNPPTDFASSAISDAQIDPALLQAVVTALRHADENQLVPGPSHDASNVPSAVQAADAGSSTNPAPVNEDDVGQSRRPRRRRSTTAAEPDTASPPTRRRRSATSATDAADGGDGDTQPRRKRIRRSRAPSLPPYDPSADPGEEIDPTAVTLAELCDDTGRGRVSSKAAQIMNNHAAWRQANREKRARQRAIAEAKKYGRNLEEEENAASTAGPSTSNGASTGAETNASNAAESQNGGPSADAEEDTEQQKGDDYDYTQALSTSRYNVQVRIGPNGETIIDETSLFVDRQEEDETANYTHIEESDTTKFVNSSTYSKKLRGSRWSAEETELFYDALQQFGENYELISYVLPGRDRKACKNKFKAEDKRNPNRITWCLKNRRPYDMQTLSRMTGKDFSGPTPVIKAPTPPSLDVGPTAGDDEREPDLTRVRKQSRTPEVKGDGEEIVGNVEDAE